MTPDRSCRDGPDAPSKMEDKVRQGRDPEWRLAFEDRLGADARTRIRRAGKRGQRITDPEEAAVAAGFARREQRAVLLQARIFVPLQVVFASIWLALMLSPPRRLLIGFLWVWAAAWAMLVLVAPFVLRRRYHLARRAADANDQAADQDRVGRRARMIRRLLAEIEQAERANEARYRAAPFPLYGLPPSVAAPRMIAGSSHPSDPAGHPTDPGGLQLELVHGDPTAWPPSLLRVATAASPGPSQQLVPLRRLLWQEVVADRLAARRRRWRVGWFKASDEHKVGGAQQLVTIPIDGQLHEFALLQEGVVQVARVELPGHVVTVRARRWPIQTVKLVQVTDLAPYLEGRRQLMARQLTALR
jgi:hypothetical protein